MKKHLLIVLVLTIVLSVIIPFGSSSVTTNDCQWNNFSGAADTNGISRG